ncbi:MAG: DUF1350 domain-containing protein, partial [Cyanobacteria bacterium]|nr:DUF1350 domain-containing protein [Cyanobacteria bacterium GSL.Bin21]
MLIDSIYPFGHFLLAIAEIWLLLWLLKLWRKAKSFDMFLLAILVATLSYDNAVLAIGAKLSPGDILEQLNRYRYYIHYITVPLLLVVGVEQANRAGAGWAIPLIRSLSLLLAVLLGIAGITTKVIGFMLKPVEFAGMVRYVPEGVSSPPFVSIAVSIFVIAIGIGIWVRSEGQWSGLFFGAIAAFIGNSLPISTVGTLPGSTSEFLLCLSLVLTERYLQRKFPDLKLDESPEFKFIPLSFNWVALHPEPKGVVYFIGGAGFGTFPTVFYRYILRQIYQASYTVVALPFRFTFDHWSVALSLVKDAEPLREAMSEEARRLGYTKHLDLYTNPKMFKQGNYFWLGHSLGCKYIALLELLGIVRKDNLPSPQIQRMSINGSDALTECLKKHPEQVAKIERLLEGLNPDYISLKNQSSILMAPIITGIEGAIPIPALAKFVKRFLDARPSQEETECLIEKQGLFHYTALIGFADDKIQEKAKTLPFLRKTLPQKPFPPLDQTFPGGHLAPLNLLTRNQELAEQLIQWFP